MPGWKGRGFALCPFMMTALASFSAACRCGSPPGRIDRASGDRDHGHWGMVAETFTGRFFCARPLRCGRETSGGEACRQCRAFAGSRRLCASCLSVSCWHWVCSTGANSVPTITSRGYRFQTFITELARASTGAGRILRRSPCGSFRSCPAGPGPEDFGAQLRLQLATERIAARAQLTITRSAEYPQLTRMESGPMNRHLAVGFQTERKMVPTPPTRHFSWICLGGCGEQRKPQEPNCCLRSTRRRPKF
jgi:hypothetical protein